MGKEGVGVRVIVVMERVRVKQVDRDKATIIEK